MARRTRGRGKSMSVVAAAALVGALSACGHSEAPPPPDGSSSPMSTSSPPPSGGVHNPAAYSASGPLGLRRHSAGTTKYLSGVWIGGKPYVEAWHGFGTWRKAPVDAVLGYNDPKSWNSMKSAGNLSLFAKFPGTLVYGVGLLPSSGGSLRDVADGKHDDVWLATAKGLKEQNRTRSVVRLGFEANGTWFAWGATHETAETFKAAFRRVARILRENGAEPVIGFDIGCGVGLTGDNDPQAPLTKLYPGDDVVDVIGCDIYDDRNTGMGNPAALGRSGKGPSLSDVLGFAKQRGKPMVVPEWGLDHTYGGGDRPEFIDTMYDFFDRHAEDIALEIYFNEGGTDIDSSLWEPNQNPRAATEYAKIWERRSAKP